MTAQRGLAVAVDGTVPRVSVKVPPKRKVLLALALVRIVAVKVTVPAPAAPKPGLPGVPTPLPGTTLTVATGYQPASEEQIVRRHADGRLGRRRRDRVAVGGRAAAAEVGIAVILGANGLGDAARDCPVVTYLACD